MLLNNEKHDVKVGLDYSTAIAILQIKCATLVHLYLHVQWFAKELYDRNLLRFEFQIQHSKLSKFGKLFKIDPMLPSCVLPSLCKKLLFDPNFSKKVLQITVNKECY